MNHVYIFLSYYCQDIDFVSECTLPSIFNFCTRFADLACTWYMHNNSYHAISISAFLLQEWFYWLYLHSIFIEFIITTCMHCFCYACSILYQELEYAAHDCVQAYVNSVLCHAYLHEMSFPVNFMYFKNYTHQLTFLQN